jgi:maltose/moltooligosaccharide transporter
LDVVTASKDAEDINGRAARCRPELSFLQIWNMCFGFLGLQFGFALQNANVSRIFQTLGASLDQIPALWTAAPLTGLLVQPIIGYYSDRTWTFLGRRRPYFLSGAILATLALFAMPRAQVLWVAAVLLWVLDASINVSMEPFRALVADQLGPAQRPRGYAMQSFFIGLGAIVASLMPWLLTRYGVSNTSSGPLGAAVVPETVRLTFDFGAAVLLGAVLWTVWRTREYPPQQLTAFVDSTPSVEAARRTPVASTRAWLWSSAGAGILAAVHYSHADPQLNIIGAGVLLWGVASLLHRAARGPAILGTVMDDLMNMPQTMRRLIPVQFFAWLALFAMWIYCTAAVSQQQFSTTNPLSPAYNESANWVGVLFAAYNGFAAIAAVLIPIMVARFGLRLSHLINLWAGGAGLMSFVFIRDPHWLLLSMFGVGFAWASILSLPYALLSDCIPAKKMGTFMGIFNFFIVIPQLIAASLLGLILRELFAGKPVYVLFLGGVSFVAAGLLALRVPEASRRGSRP